MENGLFFEKIISEYGPLVSSICRRMIQNEEDARDAAQETWLEIIKSLPSFREESRLSTWIYTLTKRKVMSLCKKEKLYSTRFLSNFFRGEPLDPSSADYEKDIWIKEMCDQCLTGILHCLDNESRLAYLFRDVARLSYENIAVIFEKDPAAVRKVVSRSRRKLKGFLNNECILYNPGGSCNCRMKSLVTGINLPGEYQKIRKLAHRANLFLESQQILPQKNYWEKFL